MLRDKLRRWLLVTMSVLLLVQGVPGLPVKAADAVRTMDSAATAYPDADSLRLRQPTADGGYILAGEKNNNIVLIKTDADGKVVWSGLYDNGGIEYPSSLRQTSDGGFILSGEASTDARESRGFYVLKVASNGTRQWSQIYSGFYAAAGADVWQLQDGSYMLAGSCRQGMGEDLDVVLLKLDDSGANPEPIGDFSESGDQNIYAAYPLPDGTSILVGSANEKSGMPTDGLIMKVDSGGGVLWSKKVGDTLLREVLQSISAAPDGGYIAAGNSSVSVQSLLLVKIDNDGNIQWERTYAGNNTSIGITVIPTRDGGYLAGGSVNPQQSPMYLLKTDANGNKQWDQVFQEQSKAYSILQLADGSFSVVAGDPAAVLHVWVAAPTGLTADDQLNRISGWDESMEYSTNGGATYTPYNSASEPVFSGSKEVRVRYKEDTAAGYEAGADTVFSFTAGINAALKEIRLDGVPLSGFDPDRSDYSVNVSESVDHITVAGAVYDAGTTLTVNGFPAQPEKAVMLTLSRQSTEINIIATAENGNTKTYSITVNRVRELSGNADLSGIAVNGNPIAGFSREVTDYMVEAAPGSESITVTADVYDAGADLYINGAAAASGEAVQVPLSGSETVISIGVTAENGSVQKSYTVTVARPELPSVNTDLSGIIVNGSLIAGFSKDVTEYTVEAAAGTEKVSIAADAADDGVRLRINGVSIASGAAVEVPLSGSSTAIHIEVTAENGTAQKVYTVTVSRPELPVGQGELNRLSISQGTLAPAFTPDRTEYTASVGYSTERVAITAETADPGLVLTINGQPADSGEAVTVPLYTGVNKVAVKVTAQNGTEKIYTIDITREAPQAGGGSGSSGRDKDDRITVQSDESRLNSVKLSAGVLEPAFSPQIMNYTATVDKVQKSLSIYAKGNGNGQILVNGSALLADGWSLPVELKETGNTEIKISVQATDGRSSIYTITAQRLADSEEEAPTERPEGNVSEGTGSSSAIFTDTSGHWAEPVIVKAVHAGIIQGFTDGSFRPDAQVTRGQFVTMLARALHLQPPAERTLFSDEDTIPDWASDAAAAAHSAGIIGGYPDGTFRSSAFITRAEMAAMLAKALHLPTGVSGSGFMDDDRTPAWAKPYVAAVAGQGIMNGHDNGSFLPDAQATRAEAAAVMVRTLAQ